jgi:hypothetical protein
MAAQEAVMEQLDPHEARSGSVLIEGDLAVLTFLTAIDGGSNVAVSMKVHVLERLHERIARALDERQLPSPQT